MLCGRLHRTGIYASITSCCRFFICHSTVTLAVQPVDMSIRNARIIADPKAGLWLDEVHWQDGAVVDTPADTEVPKGEALDCGGDLVVPGFIDLHTDALEGRLMPRPGVDWPGRAAMLAHDSDVIGAGVTTTFNAVAIGTSSRKPERLALIEPFVQAVQSARADRVLRADHRLHFRCEVTDPLMPKALEALLERVQPDAMSIMDHAPGKRQVRDIEDMVQWMVAQRGETVGQARIFAADFVRESEENGAARSVLVAEHARRLNISLATHDDETAEHIAFAKTIGAHYAEFPVTRVAAEAAVSSGLPVTMGAPNVVRGQSSGGNADARALIHDGLVAALLSDYVPSSQLHAVARLIDEGMDAARAVSLVTDGPAGIAGLDDRGKLLPGKRADFVRLSLHGGIAQVKGVWVAGQLVFGEPQP